MKELANAPAQNNQLVAFDANALEGVYNYASKICGSGLVPRALKDRPADLCIVLQTGHEMGFSPMMALRSIDVIHSVPAVKPMALLGQIRLRLPKSIVKIEGDEKKATCTIVRDRDFPDDSYTAVWTLDRAQKLGLLGKDNWKKQPGNMLKWRSVGEAARFACPDITMGLYNTYEVMDFEDIESMKPEPVDIAADVKDHKTQLSQPEAVESTTKREEIEDAVFLEVGDNAEAAEEAAIIHQIENRDYIVPLGQYEGKKLFQINIEDLRKYGKSLENGFKKLADQGKKVNEAQSALIANVTAYVSKYDQLEIEAVSGAETVQEAEQLDIEVEAKKAVAKEEGKTDNNKESSRNTKRRGAKDASFTLQE